MIGPLQEAPVSDGFEQAKAQRNWLERLQEKIPGFRGFQDRELRRDVDKLQREHMSAEVTRIKARLRELAGDYTDAGRIGVLDVFERIDRALDALSQDVRHSDYGVSGLFAPEKIDEAKLARLYEFDLELLDDLDALEADMARIPAPGAAPADASSAEDALRATLDRVRAIQEKWRRREQVISDVVQSA